MSTHRVEGYREQSERAVAAVNAMKHVEERVLCVIDDLKENGDVDQRWLQIGRTQLEQAFMAINRSIFKPERVKLDPLDD